MAYEDIVRRHRQQMPAARFGIHRLLEAVEPAATSGDWLETFRREGARLFEELLAGEVSLGTAAEHTGQAIAKLSPPEAAKAWEALATSVGAARHSRKGMRLIASAFGRWLDAAGPGLGGAAFTHLPKLAPVVEDMGDEKVQRLFATAAALGPDKGEALLACASRYGEASGAIVNAVTCLGRTAIESSRRDLLDRIVEAIPPKAVMMEPDSQKLLPELEALGNALSAISKPLWIHAVELILLLAAKSHSSAYVAARAVRRRSRQMEPGTLLAYLEDFTALARASGIRVTGFCVDKLPSLYGKHGSGRVRSFVDVAVAVAESSGPTATECFLSRTTPASREVLAG